MMHHALAQTDQLEYGRVRRVTSPKARSPLSSSSKQISKEELREVEDITDINSRIKDWLSNASTFDIDVGEESTLHYQEPFGFEISLIRTTTDNSVEIAIFEFQRDDYEQGQFYIRVVESWNSKYRGARKFLSDVNEMLVGDTEEENEEMIGIR